MPIEISLFFSVIAIVTLAVIAILSLAEFKVRWRKKGWKI